MAKANARCSHCGGGIFLEDRECLMCVRHTDLAYRDCPHCPPPKVRRRSKAQNMSTMAIVVREQLAHGPTPTVGCLRENLELQISWATSAYDDRLRYLEA